MERGAKVSPFAAIGKHEAERLPGSGDARPERTRHYATLPPPVLMRTILFSALLATLALGCDSTEPAEGTGSPCPGTGSLTATIDGVPFASTCVGGVGSSGSLVLTARESADSGSLTLLFSAAPLAAGQPFTLFNGTAQVLYAGDASDGTETASSTGGTLTVASLSSGGASGTFAFDAFVAGRTVRVTGGEFSVAF